MSTLSEKEREELSLLLPWYANGTLDEADTRRVEAALAEDDALAREFDLVLEDQAALVEMVSEEEVPLSMPERFKAALHAEQSRSQPDAAPRAAGESLMSRLMAALSPARPRAYAAIAAAVILCVPALVIVSSLSRDQQPGQYQTATGEEEPGAETARMPVKFNPDAAWSEVDAFLKENRGQVVGGPTADGLYELAFEPAEDLTEKMGAATRIFEFALPAN